MSSDEERHTNDRHNGSRDITDATCGNTVAAAAKTKRNCANPREARKVTKESRDQDSKLHEGTEEDTVSKSQDVEWRPLLAAAGRAVCAVPTPLPSRVGSSQDTCASSPRGNPKETTCQGQRLDFLSEELGNHELGKLHQSSQTTTSESSGPQPEPEILPEELSLCRSTLKRALKM